MDGSAFGLAAGRPIASLAVPDALAALAAGASPFGDAMRGAPFHRCTGRRRAPAARRSRAVLRPSEATGRPAVSASEASTPRATLPQLFPAASD
jgi:hypothetical protein